MAAASGRGFLKSHQHEGRPRVGAVGGWPSGAALPETARGRAGEIKGQPQSQDLNHFCSDCISFEGLSPVPGRRQFTLSAAPWTLGGPWGGGTVVPASPHPSPSPSCCLGKELTGQPRTSRQVGGWTAMSVGGRPSPASAGAAALPDDLESSSDIQAVHLPMYLGGLPSSGSVQGRSESLVLPECPGEQGPGLQRGVSQPHREQGWRGALEPLAPASPGK